MRKPERRKQRSIAQQLKRLLLILLVVLVVYTAGSVFVLEMIRKQTLRYMDEMSELYTSELDSRFLRISRKLFSTIMEKWKTDSAFWNYVNMIQEEEDIVEYPISMLREMYLSGIWEYGQEYQMFLYLHENGQYYQLSPNDEGGYAVNESVRQAMEEQVIFLQDCFYSVKKKWNPVRCEGETYICKIAQGEGVSLGCYVNVRSILEPFSRIAGRNAYVRLADEEGRIVWMLTSEGISDPNSIEASVGDYSISKELDQAPFEIQMRISGEQVLDWMMGSVAVLGLTAGIIIGLAAIIPFGIKKNVLMPIQHFVDNLERYDKGDFTFQITESSLLELERIDGKFKHMVHQIRKLKITLYEQELERQKTEMDYLKLQIRPHFYLNCLNFIYSMIDFGKYDCAKEMSKTTAEYLTYIFRNVKEMVPVTAETDHCRNYLEILLLRYPNRFEYYIEVQDEVKDALIFPFLIQVFVENAAKHILTLPDRALISVTVYPEDRKEGKYVNIYISDTGRGFPADLLQSLQKGERISDKGNHVGIDNCRKRFHYYYHDKGAIHFSNSPLGGAIVDIHLPYKKGDRYESIVG